MENKESVCFVGRIESIEPIKGADKIEFAIISGWEAVVGKDAHKVGDLVVIAVTDAVIPLTLAESLGVTSYLKNRKRTGQLTVKTTKLRGVYSSAMIVSSTVETKNIFEGKDMMELLEITKYQEPEKTILLASGKKMRMSKHEDFHVYYKFPNAKNAPGMFDENDEIKITRKIHGCNARFGIVKKPKITLWNRIQKFFGNKLAYYDYVYGSHQVEKGVNSVHFYNDDVWAKMAKEYNIEEKLRKEANSWTGVDSLGEGIILYGEIYGPGIQKYYDYGSTTLAFALLDVKINGEYASDVTLKIEATILDLPLVSKYYEGKWNEEEVKKWQFNRYFKNLAGNQIPEEGVVVSSTDGNRAKIAKFINPEYLEFQSKKEDSTDFH